MWYPSMTIAPTVIHGNRTSKSVSAGMLGSASSELTGPLIWLTFLISARLWTYQEGTAFVPGPDQHAGVPKAFFGQQLVPIIPAVQNSVWCRFGRRPSTGRAVVARIWRQNESE